MVQFSNIRELKNHTSEVIRKTRKGDVIITSHGKPKAILHAVSDKELEAYFLRRAKELPLPKKRAVSGRLLQDKRAEILDIASRHGVIRLRIFGSFARGEATEGSDLDILASFKEDRSLLDLVSFRQDLEDLLGRKVDVVSEEGIHPRLKSRILQEAVPL